ncbi:MULTISPECIES: YjcG family protein [Sporosarcina]|uniref:Putative phosphoesterase SAMN04244570_1797 n=1 Tax=Sporosarcina newyorkensis TaxID=759851 RepID=A0A1T4Y3B9_9BACL|nr:MULTISPECIES: YjcG family protein [Sporosarcina]MBY0221688.1 2'-5' RNA ligase family protein [Sporosarcina aquimarina]SKA96327.1 2'-5' RNA ligase [Sporosarcina newyorkensis]
MKYGIVAFPSKKLQDLANGYRKRYDPHYSLITPHMTLKDPFEANDKEIEEVAKALKEITIKNSPFELNATKVSTFAPTTNTIYFKVTPNDELLELHKDLNSNFYEAESNYAFAPHITIAQNLTSGEHDDIISQLKMVGVDHSELIDRIHLLYQLEDGSWTVYETFRLDQES